MDCLDVNDFLDFYLDEENLEGHVNEQDFHEIETQNFPVFSEADLAWISILDKPLNVTPLDTKNQSPVSVLNNDGVFGRFQVPVKRRSQRRRRQNVSTFSGLDIVSVTETGTVRRCTHCLSEKTPQWRAGPSGPKTLCNACGVRYKTGRLVPEYRPARSPTFVMVYIPTLIGKFWK